MVLIPSRVHVAWVFDLSESSATRLEVTDCRLEGALLSDRSLLSVG
jgi:hypothetical protein